MKQSKPLSVVWFDRFYLLSFLIFFADEVVKFYGYSNPEARLALMGAVPTILIGIAIWFFASVRRSHIALIVIAAIIAARIYSSFFSTYRITDLLWSNLMLSFLKVAPSLLLVLALGLMMTPTAAAWRRRETDYQLEIFE